MNDENDIEYEYSIDQVMSHKVVNGVDYYYIHWNGYLAKNDI